MSRERCQSLRPGPYSTGSLDTQVPHRCELEAGHECSHRWGYDYWNDPQTQPTTPFQNTTDDLAEVERRLEAARTVIEAARICSRCGGVGLVAPCRDGACHSRLVHALKAFDALAQGGQSEGEGDA